MRPFLSGEPFSAALPLSPEDSFVIIACDGVWDVLSDQEAVDIVRKEITKGPFWAAQRLRDTAYLLGSDDNISVIVALLYYE